MVHTRLASIRKKKCNLPTSKDKSEDTGSTLSDETPFKITLKVKDYTSVSENKAPAVASTQNEVSSSGDKKEASARLEVLKTQAQVFVAGLGDKAATELEKTPVEEPVTGEKSSNEVSRAVAPPPAVSTEEKVVTDDSTHGATKQVLPTILRYRRRVVIQLLNGNPLIFRSMLKSPQLT